jgi:hypothetical protein
MNSQTKPKYSSECMMPAAGSRSSVCIHTPDRKSLKRFSALRFVVRRSSGWPRSQFLTRSEASLPTMTAVTATAA